MTSGADHVCCTRFRHWRHLAAANPWSIVSGAQCNGRYRRPHTRERSSPARRSCSSRFRLTAGQVRSRSARSGTSTPIPMGTARFAGQTDASNACLTRTFSYVCGQVQTEVNC